MQWHNVKNEDMSSIPFVKVFFIPLSLLIFLLLLVPLKTNGSQSQGCLPCDLNYNCPSYYQLGATTCCYDLDMCSLLSTCMYFHADPKPPCANHCSGNTWYYNASIECISSGWDCDYLTETCLSCGCCNAACSDAGGCGLSPSDANCPIDGWVNVGSPYSCCEVGVFYTYTCQDQQNRDNYCKGGDPNPCTCNYSVLGTRTIKSNPACVNNSCDGCGPVGAIRTCGNCGTQTCLSDCTWGACVPDASKCTGDCDACSTTDGGATYNCAADATICTGNCKQCTGSGTSFNCSANSAACTGNCDVCNGSGTGPYNCAPDSSYCTGNCKQCTGSGTSFNCSANSAACTGNCDVCNGSGTGPYNCAPDNTLCSNTASSCYCSGSGTVFNCQSCPDSYGECGEPTCSSYTCGNSAYAAGTDCTGFCKSCNGSGSCINTANGSDYQNECPGTVGTCAGSACNGAGNCQYLSAGQQGCGVCKYCTGSSYSCSNVAADTDPYGACTGNCDECNGSGACRADAGYCTGNCDTCSGSGTSFNCAADNTLCSNTDVSCNCSGSGTSFNCAACNDCYDCSSYSCQPTNENNDGGCNDDCTHCVSGACQNWAQCASDECSGQARCDAAGGNCADPDANSTVCTTCYGKTWDSVTSKCCGDDGTGDNWCNTGDGACVNGAWYSNHCSDGIQDCNETGVDIGGACGCNLNRTGNITINFACILEGAHHLVNGNLTITSGGYIQMNANSSLTFDAGKQIVLEGTGYILKSASNTIIQQQ